LSISIRRFERTLSHVPALPVLDTAPEGPYFTALRIASRTILAKLLEIRPGD
jgi:hypothetical protein